VSEKCIRGTYQCTGIHNQHHLMIVDTSANNWYPNQVDLCLSMATAPHPHICRFFATVTAAGEAATAVSLGSDGCTQQRLRQAQFMCSLAAGLTLSRREQVMALLAATSRTLSRRLPAVEGFLTEVLEVCFSVVAVRYMRCASTLCYLCLLTLSATFVLYSAAGAFHGQPCFGAHPEAGSSRSCHSW
jgi:hypothetical protein